MSYLQKASCSRISSCLLDVVQEVYLSYRGVIVFLYFSSCYSMLLAEVFMMNVMCALLFVTPATPPARMQIPLTTSLIYTTHSIAGYISEET